MPSHAHVAPGSSARQDLTPLAMRSLVAASCLAADGLAILLAGWVTWLGSRLFAGEAAAPLSRHLWLGATAALVATLVTLLRGGSGLGADLARETAPRRISRTWHATVFALLVLAVLTDRADELPRGTIILFYLFGFGALWAARRGTTHALRVASKHRILPAHRVVIVGTEAGIQDFARRHQPRKLGLEVVGAYALTSLPDADPAARGRIAAELRSAVEVARHLAPDGVYLALPWSETETIEACVEAFLTMPTALYLAPERVLDRFEHVSIVRRGAMASLELTRPIPRVSALAKRSFDFGVAVATLTLLSPLFLLIALLIKLDTPGPVLFRQTRHGYNQRPFRIFKFRSMSTYADGGPVPQARAGDARITRVGRILRRSSLDELPQLLNVMLGQMSLVGPRPHAVPHNQIYESRIALYARRHNVKPGITGWAQVHGLRGETDTDDKMRRRVAFDLFYIDHWSLGLDVAILFRTAFSPAAYRNAL